MSVIVPARDAAATLAETLEALAAQDLEAGYEVIVVDDGSSDPTAAIAEAARLPVTVIRQPAAGPGAARNSGAVRSAADVLAFTDADCVPAPGWLREGLAALERADLVQGRVEPDPRTPPGPFDHTIWVTGPSPLYETANLLIRRALFERLGGFEDWLGLRTRKSLGEDVWLGWRARRAGATVGFCERALVHHAVTRRGPRAFVCERLRLFYFPALVRRIPELRDELLRGGLFLTAETARFDLALAGVLAVVGRRRRWPLAGVVPHAAAELPVVAPHGRNAPRVAAVRLAAMLVGAGALLAGSLRWRTPVL